MSSNKRLRKRPLVVDNQIDPWDHHDQGSHQQNPTPKYTSITHVCTYSIIIIPYWHLTFTLKALLNPEAKNPPKGAIKDAKIASGIECNIAGYMEISVPNYKYNDILVWHDGYLQAYWWYWVDFPFKHRRILTHLLSCKLKTDNYKHTW